MFKKQLTQDEVWKKISGWCDKQERSQQEARDKLYSFGLYQREVEQTVARLVSEGFVNEERFALAFARGKFRILNWGKVKIGIGLRQKRVSDYCIRKALDSLPEKEYRETAKGILEKKINLVKGETLAEKKHLAARHLISKGFEPRLVYDLLSLEEE